MKPGGALVTVMGPPPATRPDVRSVFFIRQPNRAQLVEIARRVDAGQLRPPEIGAVFSLAEARDAFTAKSSRGVAGKIDPPALTAASGSCPARRASETTARRPRSTTAASVNATSTPIIVTPNAKR